MKRNGLVKEPEDDLKKLVVTTVFLADKDKYVLNALVALKDNDKVDSDSSRRENKKKRMKEKGSNNAAAYMAYINNKAKRQREDLEALVVLF